jgi:hypothetical protein
MRRFEAFQLSVMHLLPTKLQVVVRQRMALRSPGQRHWALAVAKIYTDDCKFAVVGTFLCSHAIRIWAELTESLGLLMAVPAKRQIGQKVEWLGLHWYSSLGIVSIPQKRRVRILALLKQFVSGSFLGQENNTFRVYRSLVGMLCNILPILPLHKSDLAPLYSPFGFGLEAGLSSRPRLSAFTREKLRLWYDTLLQHSARSWFNKLPLTPLMRNTLSSRLFVYTDACKEGSLVGLGVYFHGFYCTIIVNEPLSGLHITHLEFLASCVGLLLAYNTAGTSNLVLQVDAT